MANRPWDEKREALRAVLKELRTEKGLTQSELSERLSKPQSYVSKYESGERKLDFVEVIDFCFAVEVNPQDLLGRYLNSI